MTALLTDNLPLLAGAPNGIKKLRELILELAVRGKLVPQDPNDEPASELLKRIAEEKARLVAEGKIKKQKPLAEIDDQAQPFELPVGWVWSRLGEITNFGTTTKKYEIPDDAWVLDLEDIEKDTSRLLRKSRFYERNSLSDKNSFTRGDVLYGKLRPYLNKVIVAEDDGFCTTEILPFRCHGPFVAHYFMIVLKSPYFLSYVNAKSYGMKMPRLGTEDGRQAFFPLPPLAEQRRVVAKVDELMALCGRLEARQADAESAHAQLVQALLDSLTQASDATDFAASWQRLSEQFHSLFTTEPSIDALKQTLLQLAVTGKLVPQDPSDEPAFELAGRICEAGRLVSKDKGGKMSAVRVGAAEGINGVRLPLSWQWIKFDELVDPTYPIAYGVLVPGPDVKQGVPLVRISDLDLKAPPGQPEKKISPEVGRKYERTRIRGGEVLMGVVGSIGKLGIAPDSWAGANIARAVCRIVPSELVSKRYVIWLLQSGLMRDQFIGDTRTLAQPTLNIGLIRSAAAPLPPRAEQDRIVAKLDQMMAMCDELKAGLSAARQMHNRLADELVEQAVA